MQSQAVIRDRAPIGFWILSILLVIYVAACTGFRDQIPGADAWEHHRAILALTQNLRHPGNPTYDSDIPSVRYSPYTVGLALLSKATHLDPYRALSFAAVLNTVLLCLGVWLVLRSFDQVASSGAVLLVMIGLYGHPPGYANSYALDDLPWHQVNPSAFSFGLTLIAWAIWRRCLVNHLTIVRVGVVVLLLTCAILDHAMTGVFGSLGLVILILTAPANRRFPALGALAAVVVIVGGLCLAWPYYSFLTAVRWNHDRNYWFSQGILTVIVAHWCAPAMLCAIFTLPLRHNPLVRTCLIGGIVSLALGLSAYATHSPTFARFPLPGLIYFHIALGVLLHQWGALQFRTWPAKIRELLSPSLQTSSAPMLQAAVLILLGYFLIPQIASIFTGAHLARPYFARLLHRTDRQRHDREQLIELLQSVGQHDVVISDIETSWMIPSEHGRIVAALHYELFVLDQPKRTDDLNAFFATTSETKRRAIIEAYHVKWIVLDREKVADSTYQTLRRPTAIAREVGRFTLMNCDAWRTAGEQHVTPPTTAPADR